MRTVRFKSVLLAVAVLSVVAPAAGQSLSQRLDKILDDPAARRMRGGVCVVALADGQTLYQRRADELFIPASNMKLLTTAAALDQLGSEFAFVTTFARRGEDLLVLASGDPGLGDERISQRHERAIDAPFVRVAEALKKAGVSRIDGDVIVDATVFDEEYFHPNWPADQRSTWYCAEVGGFNFNDNCIDLRLSPASGQPAVTITPQTSYVKVINKAVNDPKKHLVWFSRDGVSNTFVAGGRVQAAMASSYSVPITEPPAFAAQVLVDVLAREGVTLSGKVRFERLRQDDGSPPPDAVVLCRNEQPIGELLWRTNTYSQNFFAECLLKSLSAYPTPSSVPTGQGSWAGGRKAAAAFLTRNKIKRPAGLVIDDGSGLSKSNRVSPRLLAELLVKMNGHAAREMWFDSLATAGVDGTLRKRFGNLQDEDEVLAKTGTLANAASLSGYVRTRKGGEYAFSILFDQIRPGEVWRARQMADAIVLAIIRADPSAEEP